MNSPILLTWKAHLLSLSLFLYVNLTLTIYYTTLELIWQNYKSLTIKLLNTEWLEILRDYSINGNNVIAISFFAFETCT